METPSLSAFAIMEQQRNDDCFKTKTPAPDRDYDRLRPGDEFWLQMDCPACGHRIRGLKGQDFNCKHCHLLFRYQKK
jgi:hypothetical protein